MRQENNKTAMCPLHQILTFSIFNILLYLLFIHVFRLFLQIYGVTITINIISHLHIWNFHKALRQHPSAARDLDTELGASGVICSSCSFTLTAALYLVIRIYHDWSILLWFRFFPLLQTVLGWAFCLQSFMHMHNDYPREYACD